MDLSKPRPVISSRVAKDHIFKANSLMNEISNGIAMQASKLNNDRMMQDNLQREDQQFVAKQSHERAMQMDKLNAVNSLI